jgi:TetR/AcrR family transcriptional regulator of autoinduction and epiphytic fitness
MPKSVIKSEGGTRTRPRLVGERLEALLDIAAEVFIADGFQAASTNVIAQRAGASKASLYLRFPTKEDLFFAVLEHRMNRIFHTVAATIPTQAPLRQALFAFGTQFSQLIFNQAHIALIRVVCMEAARFPRLGQLFFELGPGRGLAILAGYMAAQIEQGALGPGDPQLMAQQFLGMLAGFPLLVGLLGIAAHLETDETRSHRIAQAVNAFILAHGTG